jgi:Uma2 family endonuclease
MSTALKRKLSPEEYLIQERRAEFKSEFYRGETFAMAGTSREHNLIAANITAEANLQLRNRPCELYAGDMRVCVSATGLYTYPEVVIVCGEPRFLDDEFDTLLNPAVLIEVLSESTEAYDRGTKSKHYRQLESLREYVIVSQTEPLCEALRRQKDGGWELHDAASLDAELVLESVGVRLPLAEIYRKVTFPPPESRQPPDDRETRRRPEGS